MANIKSLPEGSQICDPACGVGGFITESLLALEESGVRNYEESEDGKIIIKRKFLGLESDETIVCLAKSNFLLHNIEFYNSLSDKSRVNFSQLLADSFVYAHEDPIGSLYYLPQNTFDVIMANPPYVVSGTKETSQK